ncbi:MAG: ABC transporter permease [Pseudomonadota bacterium]|nr:ABC transporter permease [Pseudomonadota bacterium]
MTVFIIRRLLQSIVVVFLMSLLVFVGVNVVGDPVDMLINPEADQAEIDRVIRHFGLDKPIHMQYWHFLTNALQGDLGKSFIFGMPALQLILMRMPATLELSLISAMFSLLVGVPMGVYTGLHRDSWLSKLFMTVSLVGISLPTFLIGILLIFVFAVQLGMLPSFGRGEVVQLGTWSTGLLTISGLKALILPAITLGLFQLTLIMRLVRSEMLEVLRTDYIKFARARGLTNQAVHFGHALKNTLVPVITITGLQLGSIIAFAIITETVFQWPGMGLMFLQAIQNVDIPIMAAYLILIAFFFVVINLVVDILYYVVDPRLRIDPSRAHGHG